MLTSGGGSVRSVVMTLTMKSAGLLLLLAAVFSSAQAQWMQPLPPLQPLPGMAPMAPMQPLPPMSVTEEAQVATATAVSNGPGSASSFSSNTNGVTSGWTQSSGPGSSASASTSGPNSKGCQVISQAQSGGCPNGGTNCCSITQRVERCNGYSTAVASVNGKSGTCCVALQRISDKSPQLFCASPKAGKNYLMMPANVQIELKPSCRSQLTSSGSLACTVTFNKGLPKGFTYPAGFTAKAPLTLWANKPFNGFRPCNGGKFNKFIQAVSRTSPVALTSKCE